MSIAVVIPYFQREQGVLARALGSVRAQEIAGPLRVYIVDDASPWPAAQELAAHPELAALDITLITQPNGGPGAARNRGLDSLAPDTELVAFLDSDDQWTADHLRNASSALAAGHDAYFTNFLDIGAAVDGFTEKRFAARQQDPAIGEDGRLQSFNGDVFSQILFANCLQLSTAVIRWSAARNLRFRPEFRRAGEDILFWMDLCQLTKRFCYSRHVEVHYGKGVNVYRGAATGTPGALERLTDETRFRRAVLDTYSLAPDQRKHARWLLRRARRHFAAEVLHRLRRFMPVSLSALKRQFDVDAPSVLLLGPLMLLCAAESVTRR